MRNNGKFITLVLAGAAVGAAIGFLFATDKGAELREDISDAVKDMGSRIREKAQEGFDMTTENISEFQEKFRTRVGDVSENIKGGYEKARSKGKQYGKF
jgi:gas vesicle protein